MSRTKRRGSRSRTRKLGTRTRRIRKLRGGCGGTCSMKGGSRRKGTMKRRKGIMKGGFVKQDLVNFGRQISFGASSAYRGLLGMNPPTNPNPLVQPIKIK